MSEQKAVYRAVRAITELGAEPGDIITIRPSHLDNPLLVTRRYKEHQLAAVLDHLEGLALVEVSGADRYEQVENAFRLRALRGRARVPAVSTPPTRGHLALVE